MKADNDLSGSEINYKVRRNSIYNLIGWAAPILIQLLATPIIVKGLGEEQYGLWMLGMTIIGFMAFLDMGMVKGGIRFLAEFNGENNRDGMRQTVSLGISSYFFIGMLGMSLILFGVDAVIIPYYEISSEMIPDAKLTLYISAIGFVFLMLLNYLLSIPKALHRFDLSNKFEIAFQLSAALTAVLLVVNHFGVPALMAFRAGIIAVFCGVLFLYIRHRVFSQAVLTFRYEPGFIKRFWGYSSIAFAGRFGNTATVHGPILLVGALDNMAAITVFSVPYLLGQRIMRVCSRLSIVMFPIATELHSKGEFKQLAKIYIKINARLTMFSSMIASLLMVAAMEIMSIWMGQEFALKSSVVLVVVVVGLLIDAVTQLPSLVNDGIGSPKVTTVLSLLRGVTVVIFSIYLGDIYGVVGVATGFSASGILMGVAAVIYIHVKVINMSIISVFTDVYLKPLILFVIIVGGYFGVTHIMGPAEINVFTLLLLKVMVIMGIYSTSTYFMLLDKSEKQQIAELLIYLLRRKGQKAQ